MKRYLYILLSAFLAGMCICMGVTVYLIMLPINKILGATLFGLGLFIIIHFKLYLFTGKIGAVLNNKPKYLIDMLICLIGNVIGAFLLAVLIKTTRIGDELILNAKNIIEPKVGDTWYSILGLSFMCGILIYVAVVGHKVCPYELGKVIFAFIPIVVFIMCGYEHCIANVAYFTYASYFSWKILLFFFIMIIGNGLGSIFIDGMLKVINKLKD